MSYLTIIVLAILVVAVVLMMKRSRDATPNAAGGTAPDPLAHDRDGLNRPLPGQSARTEGEVADAARSHVGGHLEADEAARAARDSENSGGTGTAVLAGIATAGGAAAAAGSAASARAVGDSSADDASSHERRGEPADDGTASPSVEEGTDDPDGEGITNPPVAKQAGGLEPHGRHEREPVTSETHPTTNDPAVAGGRAGAGEPPSTNAPVADGQPPDKDATDAAAGTASDPAAEPAAASTNAPSAASAGEGEFRDRSTGARSNALAGTASLAVGGATAVGEATRLPDGTADLENRHGEHSDRERLGSGDTRADVREMIKILNLREGDAGRLDISKEDFASLWRADAGTPDALVDQAAARLRRMLGHENP